MAGYHVKASDAEIPISQKHGIENARAVVCLLNMCVTTVRQLNVARAAGASVAVTADLTAVSGADVIYIDDSSAAGNEQETSAFLHSWIS